MPTRRPQLAFAVPCAVVLSDMCRVQIITPLHLKI